MAQLPAQQECIPVGCVRTPAAVAVPGGLHQAPPRDQEPPQDQTPLGPGTPPGSDPPRGPDFLFGLGTPPVNRMADRCKNITLPQTSFAGGKYEFTQFW